MDTTLPDGVEIYMDQKMSSKGDSKLIRACKKILSSDHMIVMEELKFSIKGYKMKSWEKNYWEYDDDTSQLIFLDNGARIVIDLNKSKLCITDKLIPSKNSPSNAVSLILKHIRRNQISTLVLSNRQSLRKNEFLKICSTLTKLWLGQVFNDDSMGLVNINDILSMTPKLEEFYWNDYARNESARLFPNSKNPSVLPSLPNLKYFSVGSIWGCNVYKVCKFVKNHPDARFNLHFMGREDYEAFKTLALRIFGDTPHQGRGHLYIRCKIYTGDDYEADSDYKKCYLLKYCTYFMI